ncbi:uncharacterized protein LOC142628577 [Castanea sativa]|uniref:uncharacterized protein LOC142628577 n=1 Tax=Castanea sativa TaxID=21020 RepID=UPI003F64F59F
MEATQSSRGSYAWQRILKGRDVLKRGARWRIGCRENVSVWNDAWLPSRDKPTMQSPMVEGFQEAKVRDLINLDSHKWESDLIKGLFTPQEAELILSIPLGQRRTKDKLIWPFVSLGNYTVKSAKMNLVQRKILTEGTCDHCRASPEIALHALWECPKLSMVWEENNQWCFRGNTSFTTFQALVQYVIDEGKGLEKFAMLVWAIWYRRNQVRVSQKEFPYNQIGPFAIQLLHDFVQVLPKRQLQSRRADGQHVQWQPPPVTKFKVNFDEAVFKEDKQAGLGVVIRNHQGQVIASLSENVVLPPSIEDVEALVAVRAVSFAAKLGVLSTVIEGDLEVVIKALKSEEESLSTFGHLISAAKLSMDGFSSLSFTHTRRQGINLAHSLDMLVVI